MEGNQIVQSTSERAMSLMKSPRTWIIITVGIVLSVVGYWVYTTYVAPRLSPSYVANKEFVKEGETIIDTHLGSGSIAVACYNYGFDLVGLEIDKEYYTKANKRLEHRKNTPTLF